jgi:hypothetical protein
MKKGLALYHIVLVIIAVVVIATIGYLIYGTFITGGRTFGRESCKAEMLSLCGDCKALGWGGTSYSCDCSALAACCSAHGGCTCDATLCPGTTPGCIGADSFNCGSSTCVGTAVGCGEAPPSCQAVGIDYINQANCARVGIT